ncbi:hypothetical protein TNCT_691301 [Trichonephila clavata]|uniref:Uncharacterized protein n=1 Tax=Trichonephila clavata TaxID=2740835 RepID=A0A8X6H604_TRICU|nr:hypothetical protein TNCT_691301 [Trichonephila clavata]
MPEKISTTRFAIRSQKNSETRCILWNHNLFQKLKRKWKTLSSLTRKVDLLVSVRKTISSVSKELLY